MTKKRTFLAPLFSRRAALIFRASLLAMLVAAAVFGFACDDDDDDEGGAGVTGDIGRSCSLQCFDEWCKTDDHPRCYSYWCVGQADQTYCSVNCEVDAQCPVDFVCTEECTTEVAKNPVCVRETDYEHLQGLGLCPS